MVEKKIKMLLLSLTGACNLACKYCYAAGYETAPMQVETAIRAVDLIARGGEPFLLQFSGGEPLLNLRTLVGVIDHVKRNNIPANMQIQTNGTLITDEIAVVLKRGRVAVGVSLDGRPHENDAQRCYVDGSGSAKAILQGIEILKNHQMEIGVTCVVTAQNVSNLSGIVELAYYLGNIRRIGFDLLRGQGRGKLVEPAAEKEIAHGLEEAFCLAERMETLTGRKMLFSQLEKAERLFCDGGAAFSHCHAMNGEAVYVNPRGDFYACASLMDNDAFCIGNVETGINANRQTEISGRIERDMRFCRKCPSFLSCGGACYARWYGDGKKEAYQYECSSKQAAIRYIQRKFS